MDKFINTFFCCLLLFSCAKDESAECLVNEHHDAYVYRERVADFPLILGYPRDIKHLATRVTELSFDDFLGRSFKLDYFPYETVQNIGEPVLILPKLEKDHPQWLTKRSLRQCISSAFSYATFSRYENKSSITHKVNSGFEINFGLFSIGNQHTYYKHFNSSILTNQSSVFGQIDVIVEDAIYNLSINSNRFVELKKNYVEKDFYDDLYNLHPYEFASFYGSFVLTNFITGGRASALFAGITNSVSTAETREESMDSELSSSFAVKSDNNSLSLGFGKEFTNGSSSTNTFTRLDAMLTTLGGSYGMGGFTIPQSIDNIDVDLTSWVNSLNETSTHTLVDIQSGGLLPIAAFIQERNIRQQFNECVKNVALPKTALIEPKLIHKYYPNHPAGIVVSCIYLMTRFNDALLLRRNVIPINNMDISAAVKKAEEGFDKICDIYKIKAVVDIHMDESKYNTVIEDALFSEQFIGGSNTIKFIDVNARLMYLLCNENEKKIGYTVYLDKGDFLLDTYGIRDWVEMLPETTINEKELENYILIAL